MNTIAAELASYISNSTTLLYKYTSSISDFKPKCDAFLDSRMDEIRLSKASDLVVSILKKSDYEDVEFFRQGVLNREATGRISYIGQRDHSAHTLYNWLLGWYIYDNNPALRTIMNDEIINRRGWKGQTSDEREYFTGIWEFTSLLHDIGYIFEGSLQVTDPATQSEQAELGLQLVKDYFESKFWMSCGFSSTYERRLLRKSLNVFAHDFQSNQSMGKIADSLCNLGDLSGLASELNRHLVSLGMAPLEGGLPGDAFDLWEKHFDYVGLESMKHRVRALRETFENLIYKGMPSLGIRILDHGVCGALILLLVSTHYYNIRYSINDQITANLQPEANRVIDKFKNRITAEIDYSPLFWWTGIVWATASVALHNLQQLKDMWPDKSFPGKLRIQEDPLSYLGILVDILQEFDRYYVFPVPGKLPLQNTDVKLGVVENKIYISYPSGRTKKIKEALDESLDAWEEIVIVAEH